MPRRWQYQGKVEGRKPDVPAIPFLQNVELVRALPSIAVLVAASAFLFTPAPAAPEIPQYQVPTAPIAKRIVLGQDKAEPVLVPPPSFGWWVQQPEQVPGRKPLVNVGFFSLDPFPRPFLYPWRQLSNVFQARRNIALQQAEFEAPSQKVASIDWLREAVGPQPPPKPRQLLGGDAARTELVPLSFAWWQQHRDQVPVKHPLVGEGKFSVDPTTPLPDVDWYQQRPEPKFLLKTVSWYQTKAEPVFVPAPTADFVPTYSPEPIRITRWPVSGETRTNRVELSFGWYQQQPEPVRRILLRQGQGAEVLFVPTPAVYFVPVYSPEPIRPVRRPVGGETRTDKVEISFGWWRQPSEPVRVQPRAQLLGGESRVRLQFPLWGWWKQAVDPPLPRPRARLLGGEARTEVVQLSFAWWKQQPERVPAKPPLVSEGRFVSDTRTPLEDFDWFQQHPDRAPGKRPLVSEGWFTTDPTTPPAVAVPQFLFRQQPDLFRALRPQLLGGETRVEVVQLSFAWWKQQPEQTFSRKPLVPEGRFVTAPTTPLTDLDWYQQSFEPSRVLLRAIADGEALVQVVAPAAPDFIQSQQAEPIRRRVSVIADSASVLTLPATLSWASETSIVTKRSLHLYQARVEVLFVPAAKIVPDFAPTYSPEPIRRELRPEGGETRTDLVETSFGWWRQAVDPVRVTPLHPQGGAVEVLFVPAPAPDLISPQQADIFEAPRPQLLGGETRTELVQLSFGWWVQQIEQAPGSKPLVLEGWYVSNPTTPLPDFDWYQQQPEPGHIRRALDTPSAFVFAPAPQIFLDWQVQGPEPLRAVRRPVGGETRTDLVSLSFGWFQQHPERVSRRQPLISEGLFSIDLRQPRPEIGWYQQPSEPLRSRPRIDQPQIGVVFTPAPAVTFVPVYSPEPIRRDYRPESGVATRVDLVALSFGWWRQQPEQVPGRRPLVPVGFYTTDPTTPTPAAVFLEWWRQPSEPIRSRPQPLAGFFATGREVVAQISWGSETSVIFDGKTVLYQGRAEPIFFAAPTVPSFDWYRQPSEPIRRPLRPEGFFASGLPSLQTFNWLQQQPDPIRLKRIIDARAAFVFTPAPQVFLDWMVQGSEPLRIIRRLLGGETRVDLVQLSHAWQRQPSEPIRSLIRKPEGEIVLPPFPQVPTGWRAVYPEPQRRILLPQDFKVEPPFQPEIIRLDKWYQQHPGPRFLHIRQYPQPSLVQIVKAPDVFLEWFVQGRDPIQPRRWLIVEFRQPVSPLGTIFPDFVFEALECLELWDIDLNLLMPGPSGWKIIIESLQASGFVYVAEKECATTPGGLVIPSAPSGWVQRETGEPWDMPNT